MLDRDINWTVEDPQQEDRRPPHMRRRDEENRVPRYGHAAHDETTVRFVCILLGPDRLEFLGLPLRAITDRASR